jgi:hypothetical protein
MSAKAKNSETVRGGRSRRRRIFEAPRPDIYDPVASGKNKLHLTIITNRLMMASSD